MYSEINCIFIQCHNCKQIIISRDIKDIKELDQVYFSLKEVYYRNGWIFVCKECNTKLGKFLSRGYWYTNRLFAAPRTCGAIPDILFHYTSIETCIAILRSQKLRFSRLDKVNDLNEGLTLDTKFLKKLTYISCWTHEEKENILHWGRYTSDKGCRLSIQRNLFQGENDIINEFVEPLHGELENVSIRLTECFRIPILKSLQPVADRLMAATVLSSYVYGPNFVQYKPAHETFETVFEGDKLFVFRLGITKSDYWKDEKEVRFRIFASTDDTFDFSNCNLAERESALSDTSSLVDFIDIPLDYNALNTMKVVVGPKADFNEVQVLRDYCKSFFPGIVIENSQIFM